MSNIIVQIKIKPYLKDFLLHINGVEDENGNTIINASRKNITGYYLLPLLEKVPADYKLLKAPPEQVLEIRLPYLPEFNIRYRNYVSDLNMRHFQSAIEVIFLGEYYREVNKAMTHDPNMKLKHAIIDFCYAYNISFDNITYEMLRKKYTRYRAGLNKRKHPTALQKRRNLSFSP